MTNWTNKINSFWITQHSSVGIFLQIKEPQIQVFRVPYMALKALPSSSTNRFLQVKARTRLCKSGPLRCDTKSLMSVCRSVRPSVTLLNYRFFFSLDYCCFGLFYFTGFLVSLIGAGWSFYPFIRSSTHPFISSYIHPFIRSSMHPFIRCAVFFLISGITNSWWFVICIHNEYSCILEICKHFVLIMLTVVSSSTSVKDHPSSLILALWLFWYLRKKT